MTESSPISCDALMTQTEDVMRYVRGSIVSQQWFPGRDASKDKSGQIVGILEGCHLVINEIQQIGKRCRFNYLIAWQPVGSNSESASDKSRIARFISELPSAESLDELKSLQQLVHWIYTKSLALRIARCWDSEYSQPVNPLAKELDEGIIDQWTHDFIWLQQFLQENIWRLIYLKGGNIKPALQEYGDYQFHSDSELLQEIIRAELDGYFLKCTKPRYVEKAGDIKKLADLKSKELRGVLSINQRKKLEVLVSEHAPPRIWLERVLKAAGELAESDALIYALLQSYNGILTGVTRMQQQAYRNPNLKRHGQVTSTWENGVNTLGVKAGWRT